MMDNMNSTFHFLPIPTQPPSISLSSLINTTCSLFLAYAIYYVYSRVNPRPRSYPMGRGLTRSWWKPAFVEFGENPHAYLLAAQKEYGNVFWLDLLLLKPVFALSPESTVPFFSAPERDLSLILAAMGEPLPQPLPRFFFVVQILKAIE
jgi:hypothetical protein